MTTATAQTPAETWTFGIEIECYMPENMAFELGRYHHGLQVRAIDRWIADGWTAERDGSVYSETPGYVGVEIVSPKLSGEEGLTEVVAMIDWLAEIGAKVDRKCGQHVSVDARSLSMEQVMAIRESFKKLELGLFLLNGEKAGERYANSTYCLPLGSGMTPSHQRYWALNTTNYASGNSNRSRLEFRLWAGTLDATKSISYILASVGLVAGVAAGDVPQNVPADALSQLRQIAKQYVIGHRMLAADKVSDLTDICRDMVMTGQAGLAGLNRSTAR